MNQQARTRMIFDRDMASNQSRPRPMTGKELCHRQHEVFAAGWRAGASGPAMSPAEVERVHPSFDDLDVRVYLNGAADGARGDRFRLDLACGLCDKGAPR